MELLQGRLDGAVCEYTEADKMAYLHEVSQKVRKPTRLYGQQYFGQSHKYQGVTNMEMEALVFAALTNMAGIRYLLLLFVFVFWPTWPGSGICYCICICILTNIAWIRYLLLYLYLYFDQHGWNQVFVFCNCICILINMAWIRSAVVCVTLLDRLKGDQVSFMWIGFFLGMFFEAWQVCHQFTILQGGFNCCSLAAGLRGNGEFERKW